ncbi:MAG: hydroxymethylglutaryl-CoA lyase [Sphingobium sp.]|jgi:hydroxymethylglutaryl-CoA lyase|nr:hydroxymethylglutaryl-CoA lyase [Sphingobium sp.]MCI1270724.1 hydroxymethylglutaryl-CoA lyase [Sphingobium sp.]MCI1755147.1 hydroxymethylglutaryl-CoA lyase [Sphingobium sp.]MCI2053458.1 hydroxymethylglutaryl-CoA lyase [Sphingobium sp.]
MPDIEIVEVSPRDGFQSISAFIPTADKIAHIRALHAAGLRRIEATAFVSPSAVPQMADAHEVLATIRADLPNLDAQVLVPTARQTERALDAGAAHLVFVLSVSERHNWGNVRRSPQESAQEYAGVLALAGAQTKMRLNVATAFDCPYDGLIDRHQVFALLDLMIPMAPAVEVALCDTTGRATPLHVRTLFTEAMARYPASVRWAFHGHDTYGLGAANILAAWDAGVRIFDASVAGLGGCPFAPGATGNVATEDAVWMFEGMGIKTGINLAALIETGQRTEATPGAQTGGRVRRALMARKASDRRIDA